MRAHVNLPSDTSSPGVSKPKTADMHPGPGFRIRHEITRPDLGVITGLAAFETPAISDLLNRLFTMDPGIKPLTGAQRLIGPACTVKVFPGDNLMVHKSLDIAAPGDVVVVDTSGSSLTAALGDLISTKAMHRGIAGFIVDGLVRDIEAIATLEGFPVFARGVTPIGPLHRGPGEINYPIAAGGIVVNPGDIVVGDGNGVVVVPREHAEEVLGRLNARAALESEYHGAVVRGDFSNAWVDVILADADIDP